MKIIYKITNTLAALTIIPALLFLPMFRFIATVGVASDNQILSLLGGLLDINQIIEKATGINIENLPEFYTIREAYDMFLGEGTNGAFAGIDTSVVPEVMKTFFTLAFSLFVAALVFALVTVITGFFSKKLTVPTVFSVLGMASVFSANFCFRHVADQLVSGKISVTSILKGIPSLADYSTYIDYIDFDVRIFELGNAYNALLLIFGALILLNVGFKLAQSATSDK